MGGFIGIFDTTSNPLPQLFSVPTYSVGAMGIGNATLAIPDSQWLGVRYNCEIKDAGNYGLCNLQSFLAINGVITEPPTGSKSSPRAPTRLPAAVEAPQFEEMERRTRETLRRSRQ